jgi:Fur family ferric uptake transcriptional regulator
MLQESDQRSLIVRAGLQAAEGGAMSCEEVFVRQLHESGCRLTPQREMVLSIMHRLEGLATAEEIHHQVQALSTSVDISTVYRTLDLLRELRLVASVDPRGGQRRYRLLGLHGSHLHLVCQKCGRVIGIETGPAQALVERARAEHGFEIDLEHLTIPGLCGSCQSASDDRPR